MAYPTLQILREDGTCDKAKEPLLSDDELREAFRSMLRIRLVEDRLVHLQRQGRIGFFGTTTGEEAAVIGSIMALRHEDWAFPALRQGGALLHRGFPLTRYFGHMFGNAESVELGRSMPMHFSDREHNFACWSSCMATQLPHAVGMAYASQLRGEDLVAIGYLGDGATSEGDFHVAMNFAGVWKTPTVFFCNNNQWAISVPFHRQTASETIAVKARAYGFPGVRVDGNDLLACYAATRDAVERARRGEGPTLIEALTYRIQGHSSSDDPTRYRSGEEVDAWKAKDPVERFRKHLQNKGLWSEAWEAAITENLNQEIAEAVQHAENAPAPPADSLVTEVYADVPWHLARQWREHEALKQAR